MNLFQGFIIYLELQFQLFLILIKKKILKMLKKFNMFFNWLVDIAIMYPIQKYFLQVKINIIINN
jgi:hypothetical protein